MKYKCLCCKNETVVPFGISLDIFGEIIIHRIYVCRNCYELLKLLKYEDIQNYVSEKRQLKEVNNENS